VGLTESELRASLLAAAGDVPDVDRAPAALAGGRRKVRRRRVVAGLSSASLVVSGTVAASVVLSASPVAPAAFADVTCSEGGARVAARTVGAELYGVPVRVRNTTGGLVRVLAGGEGAYVPPGTTELRLALGPGRYDVSCATGAAAQLSVVDVHHAWAAPRLPCARPEVRDRSTEAVVGEGDPLALTESLLHASSVRLVGYRDASTRTVGVLRGTTVVATATWHPLLDGQVWTLGEVSSCV
jgi:hypothetical protein